MAFVKDLNRFIYGIHIAGYFIDTDNAHCLKKECKERIICIELRTDEHVLASSGERQKCLNIIEERRMVHRDDLGAFILRLLLLAQIDLLDREDDERRNDAV